MDIRKLFKNSLPHLTAIALFLFVTLIFFYPVLEGKVLNTNDGTVAKNASREIRDFRDKYGKEPLWTNSMFSGMPAYLISVKYPGNLMKHVDTLLRIIKMPVSAILLTMAGFYILLLLFRVNPWLAIGGALAYGLSTYFIFILAAGHNTKAIALAYMAPMIGSFYYAYRNDLLKGILLATFFLTLQIIANHPQITYYSFICLLIYFIVESVFSIKRGEVVKLVKRAPFLIIPVVLAVGMKFGSLYTTYEYGKYSIRGTSDLVTQNKQEKGLDIDYATQWSYGIDETMTLLIPDFKGGANKPFDRESETVTALRKNNAGQYANQFYQYWGTQPWTDGPRYVGALIVFLFILGLIVVKGPEKWWLLIATVLSIMLAWGKNFMPLTTLFMDFFPGYNKFRAVTMILVIAEFCMPLLALLALREIFEKKISQKDFMKALKIAAGVGGGLTLLFILFPGLAGSFLTDGEAAQVPDWLQTALRNDREKMLRGDSLRSLFFIVSGAGLLLAFYKDKIKKEYAFLILGLLFLSDMFLVDKRYLNNDKFETPAAIQKSSAPTTADKIILEDKDYYRVFNLTVSPFNDASTSLLHKSIGGYHGAKLKRYQELIDSAIMDDYITYYSALSNAKSYDDVRPAIEKLSGNNALNMLNTRYFIISPESAPFVNRHALGNAWFVDSLIVAKNANEEISYIKRINPAKEAVMDVKFLADVSSDLNISEETDTIYLTSYKANELTYQYSSGSDRLAVFSEIYYPEGWKAYIDGTEKPVLRADYVLRALSLPAGSHEVRFTFEPASYSTGTKVSLASSLIFFFLAAGYFAWTYRKKMKPDDLA